MYNKNAIIINVTVYYFVINKIINLSYIVIDTNTSTVSKILKLYTVGKTHMLYF